MQDFRKLIVWQKSHGLVLDVYAKTAHFPKTEVFGLTGKRAVRLCPLPLTLPRDAAEAEIKSSHASSNISLGSASELEYLSILIRDLILLDRAEAMKIEAAAVEIKKLITGLIAAFQLTTDN